MSFNQETPHPALTEATDAGMASPYATPGKVPERTPADQTVSPPQDYARPPVVYAPGTAVEHPRWPRPVHLEDGAPQTPESHKIALLGPEDGIALHGLKGALTRTAHAGLPTWAAPSRKVGGFAQVEPRPVDMLGYEPRVQQQPVRSHRASRGRHAAR